MMVVEFLREVNNNNENTDLLTLASAESLALFLRELILDSFGVDLIIDDDDIFKSQLEILSNNLGNKVKRDEHWRVVMSLIGLRHYFKCEIARVNIDDARVLARFIKNYCFENRK